MKEERMEKLMMNEIRLRHASNKNSILKILFKSDLSDR